MFPNSVGYVEGKSVAYYIDQAGGFASDAKKSNTYILYMNGMLAKVGHNARYVLAARSLFLQRYKVA